MLGRKRPPSPHVGLGPLSAPEMPVTAADVIAETYPWGFRSDGGPLPSAVGWRVSAWRDSALSPGKWEAGTESTLSFKLCGLGFFIWCHIQNVTVKRCLVHSRHRRALVPEHSRRKPRTRKQSLPTPPAPGEPRPVAILLNSVFRRKVPCEPRGLARAGVLMALRGGLVCVCVRAHVCA